MTLLLTHDSTFNFKTHLTALVLLTLLVIIGISNYQDYGISWDEHRQRELGITSYEYVFEGNDKLLSFQDKDYGVAIELPLYMVEKWFGLNDSRSVYLMRHLVVHCLFLLSAYCLFLLTYKLYQSKFLSTAAFLMLVCQPRIYAHSFFNSKDLPFLSLLIISLLLLCLVLNSKKKRHLVFFAIICGLLINVRIIGVLVPVFYLLYSLLIAIKQHSKKLILSSIGFSVIVLLTLYATWPYLWESPFENFFTAIKNMSNFRWDSTFVFFGEIIKSNEVPWYYIPVYFFITTPIPFSILGVFGIITSIIYLLKKPFSEIKVVLSLCLILLFLPYFAIIVLDSVVYDGWRQLFFLYVPFVILSIHGLKYLSTLLSLKTTKTLFYAVIIGVIFFMIALHPYQNCYFNSIYAFRKDNYLRKNFDVDYWGVSYKESLEYLLKNSDSEKIKFFPSNFPGNLNIFLFKPHDLSRFVYMSPNEADYFITNFRYNPKGYPEQEDKKVFEVRRMNSEINAVYKLR